MAIQQEIKSDAEHVALLATLLAERGLKQYGLFAVTGEGTFTPDGYEETSGYILSSEGKAFFFWTGWDESSQRTTSTCGSPPSRKLDGRVARSIRPPG
jgi:hypothetical protein